jgi:hypothetical protein
MDNTVPGYASSAHRKIRRSHSDLEDILAQMVQYWIERGWSLAAISLAMRNIAGGLELVNRIEEVRQ